MKFLVTIRVGEELEWPEVEVDAEDKWDALVKVVEGLGLQGKVTMSDLWTQASIIKKERKEIRRWRKKR